MTTVALLPQHLLSKEKLLAHVLRGLEADLAPKNQLKADASKATQRERQTQLTAPVDGVIQQLAIHTTGDLVTSAQPLMIVVPDSTEVTEGINVEPRLTSNPMQCLHQRGDMTTLTRRSTVTLD